MPQWLGDTLEKSAFFMPHGHCYLWIPWLLWMHVVSDFLIGAAYVGISVILWLLIRKIRLPFTMVFVAFGLFIALCGLTHFVKIWTVWNPDYILDGAVKAATAAASVATAIGLLYMRPQVEAVVHAARLSEERRIRLESTHAELEAMYARVREADELKSQFLANISHELRTPLALILGPAEQLRHDANLDERQRRQLESIGANGRMLLRQVNDLLDLAKLDFGGARLAYAVFDAASAVRRIASQFDVAAEQRGVALTVDGPATMPIEADDDKFERVVVNLLSNALKFTPRDGKVVVVLDERPAGSLRLSVADSGPGIPAELRERVFDRFRQLEGGADRTHGGSGLGLAIVKDFVELHGGSVAVAGSAYGGAEFEVVLPLRASRASAAVAAEPTLPDANESGNANVDANANVDVALRGALHELEIGKTGVAGGTAPSEPGRAVVLLVEDNPEMLAFVAGALGREFNVETATDGREGLAKAKALRPDLVVTDMMMPGMSGDQLVEALRADRRFDPVPVLVLTAKADDELRARLLSGGAQDYLTKPFLPAELLARARNLAQAKRAGDILREELSTLSTDIGELATAVSARNRQLSAAVEAAQLAREQAERATKARTHFLGMISHELRTPLSTIQLNLQLLAEDRSGAIPADVAPRLDRLLRASRQMTSLVDGLLEYTRSESGQVAVVAQPVDLARIAESVVEQYADQVPAGVKLEVDIPNARPQLESDRRLLSAALGNLVANALKFTREGTVTVAVRAAPDGGVMEVVDTGIGISPQDLPRIFEPFEQLEPLRRKSIPGVGLGLALVQQIVRTLGGRIEVLSDAGTGTTFRLHIPNLGKPART
jgi:signal transduction histidine kinase